MKVLLKGRKHYGKRRNCLLRAISPVSHSVFKRLVLQTHKNQGLVGKGLIGKEKKLVTSIFSLFPLFSNGFFHRYIEGLANFAEKG